MNGPVPPPRNPYDDVLGHIAARRRKRRAEGRRRGRRSMAATAVLIAALVFIAILVAGGVGATVAVSNVLEGVDLKTMKPHYPGVTTKIYDRNGNRLAQVPSLQNRTPVPAVENFLTNAVVNAFSTNGRLRVTNVDRADSILEGVITNYNLQSIAYDAAANIRQFRLTVTLNLRFRDVRRNEVLFQRNGFSDRADFAVPGTVAETITTSESALQQAATDIGRSVVSFAVERF